MDKAFNKPGNTQWSSFDQEMMSLGLALAKRGQYTARPNPMVGCVMVQQQTIVGQGWHQKCGEAHAEINALAQAQELAKGATCYVTLEPCAHLGKTGPCAQALIDAGVSKVIAAMQDPNPAVAGKGFQMLSQAGIDVAHGLLGAEAAALNRGFISRFTRKRPWLTCKMAISLDGRTALADGSSQWITGIEARADVQKLRARQDAIITGVGTLLADNPSLNVRAVATESLSDDWFEQAQKLGFTQPARVLLDRQANAKINAKLFNADAAVYWVRSQLSQQPMAGHINQLQTPQKLQDLMEYLGSQAINNVLLESGHRLAGEFLKQGLIDELVIYMAPKLMGNKAQGLFDLEIMNLQQAPTLKLTNLHQLADDIRLTYEIGS